MHDREVVAAIVAGGGLIYSAATEALQRLCERTGIPVGVTPPS